MEKKDYLAAIERESNAFAGAAESTTGRVAPMVPSCPEWNMSDLVLHLGAVQRWVTKMVAERLQEAASPYKDPSYLKLPAEYFPWMANKAPRETALPLFLVDWFKEGAATLVAALAEIDPDEPVWTWSDDHHARHWHRAQAVEAAVHRWDAQLAARGQAEPIEAELALDAIDWIFDVLFASWAKNGKLRPGNGETFHLHRTDGPGEWLLTFAPEGLQVRREHAKGDIALRGTASDLLLFLYGRVGADKLEVFGNQELIPRYYELTGINGK
ncbi:MAG TPA: maleylpyruvate isomerase family mycothiol-dependent enzyme [Chloroflexia bacterium]|nr:maleylpyruvate isomerase family mycothiol-dependent enzyme [Chloroflexia bacterium]